MQFINNSPFPCYIPASSFRRANLGNMPQDIALIICRKLEIADIIALLSVSRYMRYIMSKCIVPPRLNRIRFAQTTLTCADLSIYSMFHIHWRLRRLSDMPKWVDQVIRVARDVMEFDHGHTSRPHATITQVSTYLPLYSIECCPTLRYFIANGPAYNTASHFPKELTWLVLKGCPGMTNLTNACAANPTSIEIIDCPTIGDYKVLHRRQP